MSNDTIAEFLAALNAAGYELPRGEAVQPDDQWHRLIFNGEKRSSGRYCLKINSDGFAVASFVSDKDPAGLHKWHSRSKGAQISTEQRAELKRQAERNREIREKEQAARQAKIAGRIERAYKRLPKADQDGHEYLKRKKIQTHGVRFRAKKDELIVPLIDVDSRRIFNVQRINANGKWKGFFRGARVIGCCFPIGRYESGPLIICEGFATGASIYEATGIPVRVAFNTSNLKAVTEALKRKYPEARIVIAADNDCWVFKPGKAPKGLRPEGISGDDPRWKEWREQDLLWNPGIEKAKAAAVAIGGAVVLWPEFDETKEKPTDFNDLFLLKGPQAVKDVIEPPTQVEPVADESEGDLIEYPPQYGVGPGDDSQDFSDYVRHPRSDSTIYEEPFRILGHNEGTYYFLPARGGQIVELSATGLANIANLFRLAMADYWKTQWGTGAKGEGFGAIARYAASALIDQSERVGIFKPKYIRGVGAWMDNGRPVIHRGSTLLIDGEIISPRDYKSRFVYPVREATYPDLPEPLSSKEAVKLREICGKISWESKLSGELLAGWIVIAPVCGALNWRSHIWVEGQSETGKSTVLGQIVEPMMPGIAVRYDGGTTEAAIRQEMGVDALPIIYDEAEPENMKDRMIMEGLLLLARKSSTGAKIAKGSAGGKADSYVMRSAFCFAGINPAIKQRADESRISRLVIKKATFEGADEFFRELKKQIRETLTKDYALRMIARTISNLPTLLANIDTFADACADVLGSRRAADQIAPMLAGLYLLTSTKRIDYDAAHAWIQNHDWTLHTAVAEQSDPERLIMHISTAVVRTHGGREMTIGSLISRALGMHELSGTADNESLQFLRDMGIWPRRNGVLFSNKSPRLEKILADTPWISWSRPLSDVPGATKQNAVQFTTGLKERGVLVPLEAFGLTHQQQEMEYE